MQAPNANEALKRVAALAALDLVQDGMVIGLGTGTTADAWILEAQHLRTALGC